MKNYSLNYNRALKWVKENTLAERGIAVSSRQKIPYLEVTGYLIPTLIDAGELNLAEQYAEFLCYMQRPNGSFAGADGREYIFDSGQGLRGLVIAATRWERFKPFAQKTADYIVSCKKSDGSLPAIYSGDIPEAVHVFVLPALIQAAEVLSQTSYRVSAQKACVFYKQTPDVLNKKYLTHFLGYIIDGFLDMGEVDFVFQTVKEVFLKQKKDGSISAYPNVSWVCSVGLAQFAIIAYKLKMKEKADKAVDCLVKFQNPSGGFWGSYGVGRKYFPKEEISWTNKFFMDALQLRGGSIKKENKEIKLLDDNQWHKAMADHSLEELVEKVRKNDFPVWVQPLLQSTLAGDSILELGSGTGELAAILSHYQRKMHLLDYSSKSIDFAKRLLKQFNFEATFYIADILNNLPLGSNAVDWVFSSGVLEHFTDEQIIAILKESSRVSRKGVVSLVPNANAIFYRIGKFRMEQSGAWRYGKEIPKFSMKHYFEAAGLENIREYSVGTYHALAFERAKQQQTKDFFDSLSVEELKKMNQGYLLFTIGDKNA